MGRPLHHIHNINRHKFDMYPTPYCAISILLQNEKFCGNIWECASGAGHMVKGIIDAGYKDIICSDIRDDSSVFGERGVDFLSENRKVDNIITNPPYRFATQFVKHALECANKKVAMLCNFSFLESVSRYNLFKSDVMSKVYIISNRIPMGNKIDNVWVWSKTGGTFAHAWFIWDKDNKNKNVTIEWFLHDGRCE